MKKINKESWDEAEDQLLLDYYHTMTFDTLTAVLPGRTRNDMSQRVSFLTRKNKSFAYP
jgi:hypothetical protein